MVNGYEGVRYTGLQVIINRTAPKLPLTAHLGAISLKWNKWVSISDNLTKPIWSKRSEVEQRLLAQTCELCDSQERIEVHHIRKLADLNQKNTAELPEWKKRMIARRRKTLVVCHECHKKIQYGRYDGESFKRKKLLESHVIRKRSCVVRRGAVGKVLDTK